MTFTHSTDTDQQESVFVDDSWSQTTIFPKPKERSREGESIGSYVKLVNRMARSHPNLYFLRHELMRAWPTEDSVRGRAAVLEFFHDRVTDHRFNSPQELENYLRGHSQGPQGRLFLLEDIATDYVEALGGHFRIDPAFFARQLRVVNWENSQEASTAPPLPSLSDSEQSFSISYPQVLKFPNLNIRKHSGLYCYSNVYRAIDAIRVNHWFDRMAYIKRMLSFWSRRYPGGYWDALLLVDPAVGETVFSTRRKGTPIHVQKWEHFQGGYVDFLRPCMRTGLDGEIEAPIQGPPRTCMFDDVIYYYTQRSHPDTPRDTPEAGAFYAKKIIIATWANVLEYFRKGISVLEWRMQHVRKSRLPKSPSEGYADLEWLDNVLSALYRWKWRCSLFSDLMDNNLIALSISIKDMECLGGREKKDAQDWIYVHKKLSLWESRVRDLVDSAHCSITMIESTKSIEEARATRLLAILGTVFIPLSLVASILSMGGDFLPGESQFWVYFVVSLPLLVLSLVIVFASPIVLKKVEGWRNRPRNQRIEVTRTETVPSGMA